MAWPPSWVPGGAASNRRRLLPRCLQLSHITLDLLDVDNYWLVDDLLISSTPFASRDI